MNYFKNSIFKDMGVIQFHLIVVKINLRLEDKI